MTSDRVRSRISLYLSNENNKMVIKKVVPIHGNTKCIDHKDGIVKYITHTQFLDTMYNTDGNEIQFQLKSQVPIKSIIYSIDLR